MVSIARNLMKVAGVFVLLLVVSVVGFLVAATIGAIIPRCAGTLPATTMAEAMPQGGREENQTITIHLLSGLLHTDIVVPANEQVLEAFPWLGESRIPLDHPNLSNLSFGWGSRAFYTTAGEYSDIRFATAWLAATGDRSVMRVVGLPDLSEGENILKLKLTPDAFGALLQAIRNSFQISETGNADYLPEYTLGGADAFYAGVGHFNLLNPCNQWTGDVLSKAGIRTGRWTPTTFSLLWSLDWQD